MALPELVTYAEVLVYLGKGSTVTTKEAGLLTTIKPQVERMVRRYVGCGITQQAAAYTHYLPAGNPLNTRDAADSTVLSRFGTHLQAPEFPIRTITTVSEDTGAYAGTASSPWASTSLLTAGTDYYADFDQAGLCKSGQLIRINTQWPSAPRSIELVYTAGWSVAELRGDVTDYNLDASDIRLAVLKAIAESFNEGVSQQSGQGGSGGVIKSERLGDYSVSYDTTNVGAKVELPMDAKLMLDPFCMPSLVM